MFLKILMPCVNKRNSKISRFPRKRWAIAETAFKNQKCRRTFRTLIILTGHLRPKYANILLRYNRVWLFMITFEISLSWLLNWRSSGVNRVLIFELDPRNHLSEQDLMQTAATLGVFWALTLLSFLYGGKFFLPVTKPSFFKSKNLYKKTSSYPIKVAYLFKTVLRETAHFTSILHMISFFKWCHYPDFEKSTSLILFISFLPTKIQIFVQNKVFDTF